MAAIARALQVDMPRCVVPTRTLFQPSTARGSVREQGRLLRFGCVPSPTYDLVWFASWESGGRDRRNLCFRAPNPMSDLRSFSHRL